MATHVSATVRETPHETETTQITISDALKRRAQAVIKDRSIDSQWRNIVRYALEINDPLLPDLVRRADEGETPKSNPTTRTSDVDLTSVRVEETERFRRWRHGHRRVALSF